MGELLGKEALVVCSDKNIKAGITIWDLESGEDLIHIPTCASPPHGLLCLRNQILVASQVQKYRSFGGGAIFMWPLNKLQAPNRSYPVETIGPITCTKDGLLLFGGAPSGNAYVWEVTSGKLLKNWRAHHKALRCLALSGDDSLLISGDDDGVICVWTMISVLDMADLQPDGCMCRLHSWSDHGSSITGLLSTCGGSSSALISSSLDGTCKVWDLVIGRMLKNCIFSTPVTAIALDRGEQLLFCGCADGRIFIHALDVGLPEDPSIISEDQSTVICGHKGSITALSFSRSGAWLISASDDCTACLWDVSSWQVLRRFTHKNGRVTNLVTIPHLSLSAIESQWSSARVRFSSLEKAPQLTNAHDGTTVLLPTYCSLEDHRLTASFQSSNLLNQQITDLEQGRTPEAMQMKIEASVESRLWAASMTKQVTTMNKHLRSRLLDLIQRRLCNRSETILKRKRSCKVKDPESQPATLV